MPIRDILVVSIVFGVLPMVLRRPHVGILLWSWISYMNPHRLSWGFAYGMPIAAIAAAAALLSILLSKEPKRFPVNALTVLWLLFVLWVCITTPFALYPDNALVQLIKVLKIQLFALLTLMLFADRDRLQQLVLVIALSIGFFGFKGGLFTLLGGGGERVWGPPGTFIEDNNHLGTALLMVMPLIWYLRGQSAKRWVRLGLLGLMLMTALAVVGTYSRGAMVGGAAMVTFLWWKSRQRLKLGLGLVVLIPVLLAFMPEAWHERMDTIQTYEEDSSVQGRFKAWRVAFELANHRITGGGFDPWTRQVFGVYIGDASSSHAAHSIYFGVLGEHGWIGLALFLAIGILSLRYCQQTLRLCRGRGELEWLYSLMAMVQVSLIAYATGGAFLSLAYFDLPWHLFGLTVLGREIARRELAADAAPKRWAGGAREQHHRAPAGGALR